MNKELWDWGDEQQEQESQAPKRSLFDNLGDAITAIGANFSDVRGSNNIGDLRHDLMENGATMPLEEYNRKVAELEQLYGQREASRQQYQQAHDNLVADDSFLKNIDQLGGTLEGMAAQGIGTAVGAGLGLVGGVGGAAMGAKIGNAAGAVAGGYLDARSVALQAEEDVLDNGGTWEQARHAYDEALKKASLTTLPETLADIALGNRLVRAGLNSGMARKIAGSTIGRAGSAVLDPAARLGTKAAFKAGNTLVGRGVGLATDIAMQGSTEALQEVTQDYIGNRETAKALGQADNEYSLGGFKDYALSDQGLETMKTAGIMGALFGGAGGALSSGQYLTRGAETNTGIRAHNNAEQMINDGSLKISAEKRRDEEKIISVLKGISPAELASWSDAEIVAEASILEGQYMGVQGEAEDLSTVRGAADVVRRLSDENTGVHREGDLTETTNKFLEGMGVDKEQRQRMFNSPAEMSIIEQARKAQEAEAQAKTQTQEQEGTQKKSAPITATLTEKTAKDMPKTEDGTITTKTDETQTQIPQTNTKETVQPSVATTQPTATPKAVTETPSQKSAANHFEQAAQAQAQQGQITTAPQNYKDNIGGGWETDQDRLDESLDEHPYYNLKTGAKVTIKHRADGQYAVKGTSGEPTVHQTLKDAEQYLKDHRDQTVFQGTNGEETEETKEGTVEDPNIVPKGGVNAREGFSGQLISSVDDLYNFMLKNPSLISRGAFIEYVHAKHNIGFDNIDIYLDKKNEGRVYDSKTGKWGYVNAKKTRDEATGRAILQLYKGADFISAVHEIAHIGYDNLTATEQRTFDKYAVKSMGQWIADMLDLNYDDAFKQRLNNLQNDQELQEKINKSPALRQTVIEFLNAEKNGIDLNNLTKNQREAIDERWAWEFSLWYTEGYTRGVQPKNVVERLLQRGCFSIRDELEGLHRLWEHIHHKDNNEIEDLYRNMGTNVERQTEGQGLGNIQFTNEFDRLNMPNVNMPMNFGGEQAIQYNVPTLGESYDEAQEYAGLYNELERRYENRKKYGELPSADGSVATNKDRPINTENERKTTTGYKERTTSAAKNKREAEKLVKIIEGRKSGWEKALEKLAYVDPKRFRSIKIQNGNDLWNNQEEQARSQQEENNKNVSNTEPTNSKTETRPLPQINFTTPSLESQPMSESVTRANGINTGRPLYFNPTSEQTMNKMETIKKEQQEKRERLEKKRDLIEEKLKKAEDLFKRRTDDEELKNLLNEIHLELLRYSAINGFFEKSYSLKESKYKEFIERVNKIEEALKKEQEEQKQIEKEIKNNSKKKIEYVNKNFAGVNGLSDSTKEVVYDAYKVLSTKGNNLITSLAKENAVLYARICDRIAKAYNENEGSNKYNAKDIYDRVSLKVSNRSNLTKRGSYSASEHHDRSGNKLIDLTKRVIKTFSSASPSTFLHETTHMYYWELELIASKYPNSQAAKDFKALNDFANYKGEAEEKKYAQSLGETKGKTAELYIDRVEKEKDPDTKKYHMWVYRQEKIAQAFEEYLREGKSPNEELKSVFERFKDWILKFFGLTEQVGIKASPEVKAVFDRMVMTDEEIKQRSEEQQKTNKTEVPQNNQQTKIQTSQKKTAKKPTENVTPVVEQPKEQAKPTTPTDEIYSHLYFGDKTGKLKYNKDTKKIEYFVEEENGRDPETMRRRYKLVNKGEITPEQYNELRLKYERDFKKTKGEAKDRIPNLVEGMKKEDFMYSAYREVKQSEKEKGEVAVELGKEKQTLVTGKSEEYARQNAAEQSFNRAMSGESLSGMEETELTKEDKEEAQKQIEQELPKVEKEKTEQTTTPKTSTTTTKKTTSTKTTSSKPKTTDPLSALHKKYKNITGTPIGEKGYVFKSDEKAFIEGFKGLIDGAVGNKEQLINVAKQLDSWFQNDPTERNRMVRKYLSQYLADAAQINTNQNTEVRHQEANRAEQAQQILDKAFPNTRFQMAWHGSIHDFPEFTLDHLLSGEGAMAHGWGLYFGIDLLKNKANYFDRFSRKNRSLKVYVDGEYDGGYEEFFDDVSYSNGYGSFNITKIKSAQDIINILQKEADAIREEISNYENDPDTDPDFREDMRSLRIDLKVTSDLLDYTIENKDKIEVKNEKDPRARYYFVEIPDNKYLLREGATFSEQPPFVQKRLIQAFCDIAPITEKDALTLFKTTDKKGFIPKNNNFYLKQNEKLKKNLYRFFIKELRKIDKENSGYLGIPNNNDMLEEYVSKLLNQYGIKGISYNGQLDGECAVIFDDKAIDIITKFRQEEGKWKSEKVDNARNRESDKQKAQRKLEKHLTKIKEGQQALNNAFPNTRFQFAYHGTKYDFDRFTLEHLGKGQGQAVAGWGLYFTKHQDVAKAYHDYLSRGQERGQVVLVNIPEDDKLLHELKPFKEHPKHIQIKIAQAFRDAQREIIDNIKKQQISNSDKREFIAEVKNYLLKIDHNDFDTIGFAFYESLVDAYDYTFMNQGFSKSYRQYKSKELASKVLNKNGIEGISYYGKDSGARRGLKDRESFVIFNDKAIKILDRIKKVNGEWVSEKGDNSVVDQRDIDLAQSKLEKHRIKQNSTRFQLHSEEGLSKADINSPEFKKWFEGSILTNKDGSPMVLYRGIDQHYSPEFDKEEGSIVWVTDDLEQAESYRDTQIDMEPTLNRKTGEFTGKPSMQREFLAKGAKKESGDLLEAYVSLKKPFNLGIVNDKKSPHDFYVGIGKQLQKDVKDGKITEQQMKSVLADLSYLNKKDAKGNYPTRSIENTKHFKKKFFNAFKKVGYDGVQGQEAGMFGDNRVNVYGVFDKGDIKSIYNKGTFDRNNKDTRFMYGGNQADNQTLLTPKLEKEYEKNFRNYMRLHGFSEAFIDKYFSNDKTGKEQMIPDNVLKGRNLFNKSFEEVFNEYNKQMMKDKGVKRGLDGRWRFEFSDKESKIDSKFVSNAFISKVVNDASKKYETTLQNVLKHDKLFEYYPELKGFKVVFATSKYDGLEDADGYSDFNEIALNVDSLKKEKNEKARLSRIRRTLLHEVQHQIQDREGFASGGGATRRELQDRQKDFVTSYINKLGGDIETGKKLINAIEDVIKNIKKVPRNKRGALYDKIRNNAEYFGDNERDFIRKHVKAIINGYINDYQNENKKFGNYINNEIKEMCEYLSLSKDLNMNEELLKPIRQFRNVYWTTMGEIEARQTEQRADMTMEERSERTDVLDESVRKMKSFKDAPILVKETIPNIVDDEDTRFQESAKPLTDEEIEEMDKKEEAEYKKRQKRIEDAKDSATLSDDYKDVYSVAFTKSAQGYAENRTRMEYFDNNDRYWDRTEDKSTGKVTYTRKTPFEHHQQVVTYNGVNDVTREQKKKSKPRQWLEWMKDQLIKYMFNDKHYLAKAARKLGVYDAYRKMIVTEGYALKANTALTQGIKYNGKRTRALNDIIRDVGEENQKDFIDYCIAHRIIDLANRTRLEKVSKDDKDAILIDGKYYKRVAAPVFQKMKPDEAKKIIADVKAGKNADMFEKNRKDFVEYNQALLHVLVEGGILTEKKFKEFCEVDPNFVPLAKVMDDADFGFSSIVAAHNLVNVETPIKKIGTSMREVANPFLEMQKRTAEYYSAAARNKAGQIFVNEIAEALDIKYDGNVVARGQQMINRVKVQEVNGELITKPDDKKQIIYVCNNGEHQFYQIPDREIYEALRSMDSEQMGTIHKMLDRIAHVPSGLVRETATMVPDFGVRNLIRDGGEAFLTSEHGFLPVIDQIWGMWQVANNTEWAQMYFEQNGEYGTLNREKVNAEGVASVEDVIDEKLNPLTNFNEIKKAQMAILKDKKRQFDILTDIKEGNFGDAWEHTRKSRGMAALKLAISPLWAIGKTNKRMNDLFELGTRVGEFKNAKMGFEGTLDRMAKGLLNTDIRQAKQSDIYSAHVAKDITLNFAQHGVLGKQLNRYIPFFNASLQGIYKLCNTIETMATGTTMSGGKNRKLQQELLFKAALITAMAIGVASAGDGDEDYEEAPDYEKENFWILPNGLRFPKDQVLGKVIGNTVEKSYAQWKKGKAEPSDILRAIIDNFKPDKFMPAIFDLAIGGFGNYDTFRERAIVPEYMADKLGHLQKDISTSNFAVDVSEALWKCGFNISAKKIDWALQKNFSNCAKYATSIYDLGKKGFNPKDFNERIARGYDKNDSTGAFVAGLKDDVPNPINLVSGTFATNRSTFKSISDFYENYRKYKVLSSDEASMSKEDKRIWKRYEQAYKKDMTFRKQLRAIKQDKNLTGKQKREKADKIFKQQIKLAKWAEG